jgi:hypothetical protein
MNKDKDFDVIKEMLERAEIDYETMFSADTDEIFIETASGVYFTFYAEDGSLVEVANG